MRETDRSIADIADASGFSNQSFFDKRFKRAFCRTPKEFRADTVWYGFTGVATATPKPPASSSLLRRSALE